MKRFLLDVLKIADQTQLQAALVKWGIKVGVVALWTALVFIKGCSYGTSRTEAKYFNDIEKSAAAAAKTTGQRAGEAVKTEKDGQRRAARLDSLKEDANEAFNSNGDCYVSDDELFVFNELAEEASR